MNRLFKTFALIVLGVWMATPIRAEDAKPFVLEKFFVGDLTAEGSFTNVWTGARRDFNVKMKGRWDGVMLTLKEDFAYSDGETDTKTWVFTKLGEGHYAGTREDVVKEADVQAGDNNDITLNYTAKLGGFDLDFSDRLIRVDPATVHNTADVYFLGFIKIGEVDLTIKRKGK
jgi:Protein of unknown function (DUF3833)